MIEKSCWWISLPQASPPTHIQDVFRINIRCYVRHLVYWCNVSCFTPGSSLDCSQFLPICKSVWHLDGASSRCYRNSNLNIPQLLVLQYFYKSFRDPWPVKAMVNSPLSTSCWYLWHEFGRSGCSRTHSFSSKLLYPVHKYETWFILYADLPRPSISPASAIWCIYRSLPTLITTRPWIWCLCTSCILSAYAIHWICRASGPLLYAFLAVEMFK